MPVQVRMKTCRLAESDFAQIAYDVMGCIFDIHHEFGRFFDEKIYKRELGRRYPETILDVPIEVRFDDFHKLYFLDAVIGGGAVFDFKTVDWLTDRQRSFLLHRLLLADLPRGKLVNLRTEQVQHEFVNTKLRLSDRTGFRVVDNGWRELGAPPIREWLVAFLRDVGACLDVSLR